MREPAECDVLIVGGGLLGLATAYSVSQQMPDCRLMVLEKDKVLADYQSGCNGGLLHAGLATRQGTFLWRHGRDGYAAMLAFCQEHDIPHRLDGISWVALEEQELKRLEQLGKRARQRRIPSEILSDTQLLEMEPHCRVRGALHLPDAGVVDYRRVSFRLCELIQEQGGNVRTGTHFQQATCDRGTIQVTTSAGPIRARVLINCAGAQSDLVAQSCGHQPQVRRIAWREAYYELRPRASHLCRTHLFTLPREAEQFPKLRIGRTIHDYVECGPTSSPAWRLVPRGKLAWSNGTESLWDSRYWRQTAQAAQIRWRQACLRSAFLATLQKLVPALSPRDLLPLPPTATALPLQPDGTLADDLVIQQEGPIIHVLCLPPAAATVSLSVGRYLGELATSLAERGR